MRGTIAILALAAATSSAQAEPVVAGNELRQIEADVPRQDWYPEDYYDVRIAAEAQVAEFPRPRDWWLMPVEGSKTPAYNVHFCGDEFVLPDDGDESLALYGDTALLVSRIRSELHALGYPTAVYAEALGLFEKQQLQSLTPSDVVPPDTGENFEEPGATLASAIEARRAQLAPRLPPVTYESCGGDAPPAAVIVRTEPRGGEVMLISAFAFKVCSRKQPDPWDRFACRWTEMETETPAEVRGRVVYQARWPDGTQRRGTRELKLNYDNDEPTVVIFRKSGS